MTTVTDRIDGLPSLIDPATTDPRFLPWIASWVGFELDTSLPIHQQRELVRRAIRLYRTRGTVAGIEEMIRVLTAAPTKIAELQKPKPFVLGRATLSGPTIEDRYQKKQPQAAAAFLVDTGREATCFFAVVLEPMSRFRKGFGERAPQVLQRIAHIVTNEKPGHVNFTILFDPESL
jgi:phage tail-like protein